MFFDLKRNKKIIALLILAIFIFSQILTLIHITEHNLLDHDHADVKCELSLYFDKLSTANKDNILKNISDYLLRNTFFLARQNYSILSLYINFNPRAPPFFLFQI